MAYSGLIVDYKPTISPTKAHYKRCSAAWCAHARRAPLNIARHGHAPPLRRLLQRGLSLAAALARANGAEQRTGSCRRWHRAAPPHPWLLGMPAASRVAALAA